MSVPEKEVYIPSTSTFPFAVARLRAIQSLKSSIHYEGPQLEETLESKTADATLRESRAPFPLPFDEPTATESGPTFATPMPASDIPRVRITIGMLARMGGTLGCPKCEDQYTSKPHSEECRRRFRELRDAELQVVTSLDDKGDEQVISTSSTTEGVTVEKDGETEIALFDHATLDEDGDIAAGDFASHGVHADPEEEATTEPSAFIPIAASGGASIVFTKRRRPR